MDESFPQPIIAVPVLERAIRKRVSLQIRTLDKVDNALFGYHDHDLIRALDGLNIEGLITCDDAMLFRPEVQRAIEETGFSIVTARRAGDDAIRATGLLMVHLREIASSHRPGEDQVWRLGAASSPVMTVAELREKAG